MALSQPIAVAPKSPSYHNRSVPQNGHASRSRQGVYRRRKASRYSVVDQPRKTSDIPAGRVDYRSAAVLTWNRTVASELPHRGGKHDPHMAKEPRKPTGPKPPEPLHDPASPPLSDPPTKPIHDPRPIPLANRNSRSAILLRRRDKIRRRRTLKSHGAAWPERRCPYEFQTRPCTNGYDETALLRSYACVTTS
jgi:hypothetical protein